MNDKVKVKLTNKGFSILQHELDSSPVLFKMYTKTDTNGYSEFQLWDLMNLFGRHIYNGCEVPFETEIKII